MNQISTWQAQTLGEIQGTLNCLDFGILTKDEVIRDIKLYLERYNKQVDEFMAGHGIHVGGMN